VRNVTGTLDRLIKELRLESADEFLQLGEGQSSKFG
jgi:hypothetical protein